MVLLSINMDETLGLENETNCLAEKTDSSSKF